MSISSDDVATHPDAVWRNRANYVVLVSLNPDMPGKYEQLWARRLGPGELELCCLPFFAYGLALGDRFSVRRELGAEIVEHVTRQSGHGVLRIAFRGEPTAHHEDLHRAIAASERPHEWRASGYVAIDTDGSVVPLALAPIVEKLSRAGLIEMEWAHLG